MIPNLTWFSCIEKFIEMPQAQKNDMQVQDKNEHTYSRQQYM